MKLFAELAALLAIIMLDMGKKPFINKLMQGFTPTYGKSGIIPVPKGLNVEQFYR